MMALTIESFHANSTNGPEVTTSDFYRAAWSADAVQR